MQANKRLPSWLSRKMGQPSALHNMKNILRSRNLHTVCESARCPNIGECFSKPTATFMILGDICTRQCGFCSVDKTAAPLVVDAHEPRNIALTAKELGLRHVVITSVTRDDLADGGATQFALTIRAVKDTINPISIEVLTPDFKGDERALKIVLDEKPDIFNHNIETVPSLYAKVRPQANYRQSLKALEAAKKTADGIMTKSGLMVGLGETRDEIKSALKDLLNAGCDAVTIGQYLRPTIKNLDVKEYIPIEVFKEYESFGKEIGLKYVYSGPFVRSSYNAELLTAEATTLDKLSLLKTKERLAVQEFARLIRERFGSIIKEIILFGSKVKKGTGEESDIDILIVLSDVSWKIKKSISELAAEENIKYGVLISTIRYDAAAWENSVIKASPFGRSVRKEGIWL